MLHIATVHWKNDQWIETQHRYFKKYCGCPFKMYAFVNDIKKDYSHLFHFYSTESIHCCKGAGYNHGTKLNILADVIASHADENDIIVFIDGDAFPISDISTYITEKLKKYPLLAVRRSENLSDIQPHPCFSATTIKTWKTIRGDWCPGFEWKDSEGHYVTDTGGNLLERLLATNTNWLPVLRTNKVNLNPLWFGVYGDVVYHHGAGFRGKIERIDLAKINNKFKFRTAIKKWQNSNSWIKKNIGYALNSVYNHKAYNSEEEKVRNKNEKIMKNVFEQLSTDMEFWKQFIKPVK